MRREMRAGQDRTPGQSNPLLAALGDTVTHVCPRSQFEMKHSSLGEKYFMEQSENYLIQTLEISQLIQTWETLNATLERIEPILKE